MFEGSSSLSIPKENDVSTDLGSRGNMNNSSPSLYCQPQPLLAARSGSRLAVTYPLFTCSSATVLAAQQKQGTNLLGKA